jgi:hypothetical protein
MAFQFCDTFCTITSSAQSPYENIGGSITYSSAYARFAAPSGCQGGGVKIPLNGTLRKNLQSNQATLIAFCSFGALALPSTGNSAIMAFLDNGTCQCLLAVTPSGALQFYRGTSGGTVAIGSASSPGLIGLSSAPAHGIEVQVTINSSTGSVKCWLDGVQVINSSGLNTQFSANAFANQAQLGGASGSIGSSDQGFYCDYFRVWDGSGSSQNAALGTDRQPITKLPSGTGSNTNWSPTGFSHNYQCVSVVPPSGSDYVSASGTNVIDDYATPSAGLAQAPSMVVAQSYYQKTDGATRTYTNGVLSSGVSGVGSTFTANSGLTWVQNCIVTDPATGVAWTAGGADAAHFLHEELT